ncbi:MAG: GNAT family N-acetyltransferase, partial [Clostridiales bacterium]|nr:GNAT family N-acetyltransferase [Clostridiales bacterium]
MNYYVKTLEYYAAWLDIPPEQFKNKGIMLNETEKRRICQRGHSRNYEMFCAVFKDSMFISFSPELCGEINFYNIFSAKMSIDEAISKLHELFPGYLLHRRAHYFTKLPAGIDTSKAAMLRKENYQDYLKFFMAQHPTANPDGWLQDYFNEITEKKRCFGVFEDGLLVCATGAPDIPFMEDIITEPGIDTLPEYRRKDYAFAACA